ncbi:hybrid sensor histidine kinase/response regulator [Agaricicola taiwanensis]|nr:PAS domain-containing sensor histidine kinase [Agaricicola taiwanensis]
MQKPNPLHAFLPATGEAAELVAGFNWAATSIGSVGTWPEVLRATVALILQSPVPIVTLWGEDGIMIYNDAYSIFAGGRHPQLFGSKVREGWAEIADFNDNVMRVGLSGRTLAYRDQELTLTRRGIPEPVWMNLDYSPVVNERGLPIGVMAIVVETTEKVRAERALAQLNATLESRVEERTRERDRMWRLSTDVMVVADFSGRIVAVNPAWTSQLGWAERELIGADLVSFVHPDDMDGTRAEVQSLSRGVTTLKFENRYRHKDGSWRWLSWSAVPDENFIHAAGRDIQAEKEAAGALKSAEDALRQSQKMEAVGQLTGGIAHDFNNLLTGIGGNLELLQQRIAQGRLQGIERYIEGAQTATRRAASLTHRLLAFSRRQTLDPKPTDANRLIGDLEELIRRTVGPQIEVEVAGAAGLWTTRTDRNQLDNAILNLCINARDAMPHGGRLTIETANRWMDHMSAGDRDLKPGQYISICVSDTGTGMTPEVMNRAFDPFFTTKPMGQGTGLGLSMIYGFARQSGGQVRIYSEEGQGSMVCIYLPRHFGEDAVQDETETSHDLPRSDDGETVLVVDDEPGVRLLVTEVLRDLGYRAIEAADGPAGLRILQSDARVDLLITDVGLPGGMNGRQVADAARQYRASLKVLFITGYAENAVIGNGHLDPGMEVLTKPFTVEGLANRIRTMIES